MRLTHTKDGYMNACAPLPNKRWDQGVGRCGSITLQPANGVPAIKGEKVPSLGLGTWRLSGQECVRAVERALALGYRHIDTAQMYANEGEVERGIQNSGVDREDIFLVTKVRTSSFSHDEVIYSTHESLKKLQTEYVDLLLMHWPNPSVPLGETLGAMR
jgi:2,5-diketo-D-gluconate reductase B